GVALIFNGSVLTVRYAPRAGSNVTHCSGGRFHSPARSGTRLHVQVRVETTRVPSIFCRLDSCGGDTLTPGSGGSLGSGRPLRLPPPASSAVRIVASPAATVAGWRRLFACS